MAAACEIKIPDNISAVRELVRTYGWAKPDRVELSARVNVVAACYFSSSRTRSSKR